MLWKTKKEGKEEKEEKKKGEGVKGKNTYNIILDPVNLGVRGVAGALLVQVVLNPVDAHNARLLESPAGQATGKLAVVRGHGLGTSGRQLDLGVEPGVRQQLSRTQQGQARRVARLQTRHQLQLSAGRKELAVCAAAGHGVGLLLGVVTIGGARGRHNGCQERAVAENVTSGVGQGQQLLAAGRGCGVKQRLDALAGCRDGQQQDVVQVRGGAGVVVEVVDDEAGAVGGEDNVKLAQEGGNGRGGSVVAREGHENVALGVEELHKQLGRQIRTEAY